MFAHRTLSQDHTDYGLQLMASVLHSDDYLMMAPISNF
jgi:hypothetical protein